MNLKKTIAIFCFLLFFISKTYSMAAYYLIVDKDTFTIGVNFLGYDGKITSKSKKMMDNSCIIQSGGWPTWEIENDSLFLKQLKCSEDSSVDLSKQFKRNYINGRVFAKEVNYKIIALRATMFTTDTATYYDETECFLTIKQGKVVQHVQFTGTTHITIATHVTDISGKPIVQNTDWYKQPKVPLKGGREVIVKISVNDEGRILKTKVIEGGGRLWNKATIKLIKKINQFDSQHIFYRLENVIYKKEILTVIFKKPR